MSGVVRVLGAAELGKLAQMTLLGEVADWPQLARADVAGLFGMKEAEEDFSAMVDGWAGLKATNGDARAPNALDKARA
eukprot:5894953-Amphidinium_carterae.1